MLYLFDFQWGKKKKINSKFDNDTNVHDQMVKGVMTCTRTYATIIPKNLAGLVL